MTHRMEGDLLSPPSPGGLLREELSLHWGDLPLVLPTPTPQPDSGSLLPGPWLATLRLPAAATFLSCQNLASQPFPAAHETPRFVQAAAALTKCVSSPLPMATLA